MRFLCALTASCAILMSSAVNAASVSTIDFEHVGVSNSSYPSSAVGFDVSGYHFGNSVAVLDVSDGAALSNFGPAASGKFMATNNYYSAGDISISRTNGSNFDFYGVALFNSIYSNLGYALIAGYKAGALQQEAAIPITGSRQWVDVTVDLLNVDEVRIFGLSGGSIFFDDVRVSTVPELPVLPMLISGLGLLCTVRRRQRS